MKNAKYLLLLSDLNYGNLFRILLTRHLTFYCFQLQWILSTMNKFHWEHIKNTLRFITRHENFLPVNWAPLTPTSEVGGLEKLVTPSRPAARSRGWTWWWRRPRWWRWWSRGCSSRSWGRRSGAERILGRWSSWCTRRWRWKERHIPLFPARHQMLKIKRSRNL